MAFKIIVILFCLATVGCEQKSTDPAAKTDPAKTDSTAKTKREPTGEPVKEKSANADTKAKTDVEKADSPGATFEAKTFAKGDLPKGVKVSGGVKGGLRWDDVNGENYVVFSRAPSEGVKQYLDRKSKAAELQADGTSIPFHETDAWLYATHVVRKKDGSLKTMREVKQRAVCETGSDLLASFMMKASGVTDLDKDNIGEATFGYAYTCTTDVSPQTYKLFVIENGEKFVLRGTTRVEDFGGTFKPDDAMAGNAAFLAHATAVWNKTKKIY